MNDNFFSVPLDSTGPKDIAALDKALREKYEENLNSKATNSTVDEQHSA